jgi:hypothetical protein
VSSTEQARAPTASETALLVRDADLGVLSAGIARASRRLSSAQHPAVLQAAEGLELGTVRS